VRKDMAQVIIDRPRKQSRDRASQLKGKARRYYKETGKVLGMFGTKEFNDHTAPLNRWLHKQVGRPWSEVWSEVCQAGDNRNIVNKHLRQHVRSYVSISSAKNGIRLRYSPISFFGLWVDDNGILRDAGPYKKSKYKPGQAPWVFLGPTSQLTMIDGIWYYCEVSKRNVVGTLFDFKTWKSYTGRLMSLKEEDSILKTYGRMVGEHRHMRHQLSKKELEKYGLKNGVMVPGDYKVPKGLQ
jgi:hypothetical protein